MSKDIQIEYSKYIESDAAFNRLYPTDMQLLAKRHWTPIHITELAVEFLASKGSRILDIGSGVGKFCLAGACYALDAQFVGVEQRKYLIDHAQKAQRTLGIHNASFINANFTQLNLREFDHFYFFNSFEENIDLGDRIDESIGYSSSLYQYYTRYLYVGLHRMPKRTKIATYHYFGEMPKGYDLVDSYSNGDLNFWEKK